MNFMEILWNQDSITIEKASTTLDEIMSLIGKQKAVSMGITRKDLRKQLEQWGKDFQTSENKPMIFWSDADISAPDLSMGKTTTRRAIKPRINNPSFMIDALIQIKTADNTTIIDKIISLLSDRKSKTKRIPRGQEDPYTTSGKVGDKEIREYNNQEDPLHDLLDKIDKGHNYRRDRKLLRELIDNKVLSSHYLSLVSQALYGESKKVHPRIIDLLRKPKVYQEFMSFLKSQGKNLPREDAMRAALGMLEGRASSNKRIVDLLINRPDDYRFNESMYDGHLDIINSILNRNLETLDERIDPIAAEANNYWDVLLEEIREDYNNLSRQQKRKTSSEQFEGNKITNLIKEILEDIQDLERTQKAKEKLIEIGQSNGKSGTINNTEYDAMMEKVNTLKQTYYFNKYTDDAQRRMNDSAPGKRTMPKKKKTNNLERQIISRYREIKRLLNDVKRERNIKTDSDVDSMLNVSRDREISRYNDALRAIREQFPRINFGDEEE